MRKFIRHLALLPAVAAMVLSFGVGSEDVSSNDVMAMAMAVGAGDGGVPGGEGVPGSEGVEGEPIAIDPVEPMPARYWCKPQCTLLNGETCSDFVCKFETKKKGAKDVKTGFCIRGERLFSGVCEAKRNGPLETCDTKPANAFCVKYYKNACDTKDGVLPKCTNASGGCGSATKCQ